MVQDRGGRGGRRFQPAAVAGGVPGGRVLIGASHDEPVVPTGGGGLVRFRLGIAYDGTDFSGWARQPERRTVCGVIEDTMSKVLRQDVRLTVAGRTDAGVHATGQVAHCDLLPTANSAPRHGASGAPSDPSAPGDQRAPGAPSDPSAAGDQRAPGGQSAHDNLRARLARALPPDVRLTSVTPAPPAFDARFSALRRHYVYRVCDSPWAASPLRRRDTVTWPRPLDLAALDQAAEGLLGEHDFVAFCRRREGATTIRELQRLTWTRDADGVLNAHVTADAFCHSMVRSLVGALIAVGEGRRPPEWPRALLSAPTRSSEVTVAPAHGLTLVQVDYPPDDQLATRATLTRNLRTTP